MQRLTKISALLLSALWACDTLGQLTGYEALTDWSALSWSKAVVDTELFSSYDRAGDNLDYSHFLSPTGFQTGDVSGAVAAQVSGPGVVRRFWMPHATADRRFDLRVIIDGVTVYDTDSNLYLQGDVGYVDDVLTTTYIGGQTSYEPIVFQDSLVIETNNFDSATNNSTTSKHYYQHTVQKLPRGSAVLPTTGTLSAAQQSARDQAAQVVQSLGSNPAGPSGTSITALTSATSLPAGATLSLSSPSGMGVVRSLNLSMASASDAELDTLRLRVRYDGEASNAIDVPVSHFFGVGAGRADYQSLPLGVAGDGSFYSYWPMPFRDGAEIELYNPGGVPIGIDMAQVEIEPGDVATQAGYLHAVYNQETTTAGQTHHEMLDVSGKGHYVGNMLWLELTNDRRNILEGDDIIIVDGTEVLYGTGLEDAYNGGYYYNHVGKRTTDGDIPDPESGTGAFSGLLRMDFDTLGDAQTRTDQYRWLITDPVAFDEGINVKIENFNNQADVQFGSTVFYYLVDAVEGDLNGDGGVGIEDLDLVLAHWGQPTRAGDWAMGDASQDGWVGEADLAIVLEHWDTGPPPTNVPEPASVCVLGLCVLGLIRRR